jgi:hypothetical protein
MLKPEEREKLQDCLLLLQSARKILVGLTSVPDVWLHEMEKCFQFFDDRLMILLRS